MALTRNFRQNPPELTCLLDLILIDEFADLTLNLRWGLEKDFPCPTGSGSSLCESEKKAPPFALDLCLYENVTLTIENERSRVLGMSGDTMRGELVCGEDLIVI